MNMTRATCLVLVSILVAGCATAQPSPASLTEALDAALTGAGVTRARDVAARELP